jgi:hypothetical protein
MAIRRFSTAEPGVKGNKFWDQDTQQGAMVPIGTVTVSTNNSTQFLTFSSIPQTYKDLQLVINARSARALSTINFHVTTNSGQFFSGTVLFGDGSTAQSSRFSNGFDPTDGFFPAASATAGFFGTSVSHILNYANTSTFKTTLTRFATDLNGGGGTGLYVNLVRSTNAITTLNVYTDFADYWAAGTTATLYGIKAGA